MASRRVRFMAAGTANWSRPLRTGDETLVLTYEAFFAARLVVYGGPRIHLKMRLLGMDDMDNAGETPAGFGKVSAQDDTGDWLYGAVTWLEGGGNQAIGRFELDSGTGKWAGATVVLDGELWFDLEDPTVEMPPTGPARAFAFLDGKGRVDAPALEAG